MNKLLILGAGGHSEVVLETAKALNFYSEFGLLDDLANTKDKGSLNNKDLILGDISTFKKKDLYLEFNHAFVAIGDPKIRLALISEVKKFSFEVPSLIHPKSFVADSAILGSGSIVMANAVLQTKVKVGNGVIINTSAVIDHHTALSDGVHVCPGVNVAGEVKVGPLSWLGIGSSIIQRVEIGSNVTIGAGSVVLKSISSDQKVVGIPASIIKN